MDVFYGIVTLFTAVMLVIHVLTEDVYDNWRDLLYRMLPAALALILFSRSLVDFGLLTIGD